MNSRLRALFVLLLAICSGMRLTFPCTRFVTILIWTKSPNSSTALFRFAEGEKVGFVDASGRVVIPPSFDPDLKRTGDYSEGLASVRFGEKWGFIDASGRTVIEPRFLTSGKFSEGVAALFTKTGNSYLAYGYIDKSGKWVIPPELKWAGDFAEGLAPARAEVPHPDSARRTQLLAGYIDHSGRFVIPAKFAMAQPFSEGRARVAVNGICWFSLNGGKAAAPAAPADSCGNPSREVTDICGQGFIDHSGALVIDASYEDAWDFQEGRAAVKVGGKWGFIDLDGKLVIEPRFDLAWSFSEGVAPVQTGGKWGYINRTGEIVIPPRYDSATSFSEGLAQTASGNRKMYIDHSGKSVISHPYSLSTRFAKGLAHVRIKKGTFGYINRTGKVIFKYRDYDPW